MKIRSMKPPPAGFSDQFVKSTEIPPKGFRDRYIFTLPQHDGVAVMLMVSCWGKRSWHCLTYDYGRAKTKLMGHYPSMRTAAAYKTAIDWVENPSRAETQSQAGGFQAVATEWVECYVDRKRLRSKADIEWLLKKYLYPKIGHVKFTSLTRSHIREVLNFIQARHGAPTSEKCRGLLRRIFDWYDKEHDWPSPIANLPKRYEYQPRSRLITDAELAAIWAVCDRHRFGAMLQLLFLTGQRLAKIQYLHWDDIDADGVWTVRTQPREKGNVRRVRLPPLALSILEQLPRHPNNSRVFREVNVFTATRVIQRLSATSGWIPHDARRWAKSAMQRLGIPREHSEAVLGHTLKGVEGIYGVHEYFDEKGEALRRLAELIGTITAPDKVLPIRRTA
jgi:integrase